MTNIGVFGHPGIGKSYIPEELCKEMEIPFEKFYTSHVTRNDVNLSVPDERYEVLKAIVHQKFKAIAEVAKENPVAVFIAEEITQAPPEVVHIFYQVLLERKIGDVEIGKNVLLIVTGNYSEDAIDLTEINRDLPFLDRFGWLLTLEADFDEWSEWAAEHNVHPWVVGYLFTKRDKFCKYVPGDIQNTLTPRRWTAVGEVLSFWTKTFKGDELQAVEKVRGMIPDGIFLDLKTFVERGFKADPRPFFNNPIGNLEKAKDVFSVFHLVLKAGSVAGQLVVKQAVEDPGTGKRYEGNGRKLLVQVVKELGKKREYSRVSFAFLRAFITAYAAASGKPYKKAKEEIMGWHELGDAFASMIKIKD